MFLNVGWSSARIMVGMRRREVKMKKRESNVKMCIFKAKERWQRMASKWDNVNSEFNRETEQRGGCANTHITHNLVPTVL